MRGDGLHLTNESAEVTAYYIVRAIELNQASQNENIDATIQATNSEMIILYSDLPMEELQIIRQAGTKIIEAGGKRIKKLKTLHNVEINPT